MGLGMVREQVVFIHITCDGVESRAGLDALGAQ